MVLSFTCTFSEVEVVIKWYLVLPVLSVRWSLREDQGALP